MPSYLIEINHNRKFWILFAIPIMAVGLIAGYFMTNDPNYTSYRVRSLGGSFFAGVFIILFCLLGILRGLQFCIWNKAYSIQNNILTCHDYFYKIFHYRQAKSVSLEGLQGINIEEKNNQKLVKLIFVDTIYIIPYSNMSIKIEQFVTILEKFIVK